tara:strand:- start:1892 stop:2575 length:684 start_codon:yes stop_codon:yes gene_type:complete
MGNGPSLKLVDLASLNGYSTFGLNAAYRMYRKINWWPTYHGCFDYIVCESHRKEFQSLINDPSNGVKKFFFIKDFDPSPRFQKVTLSGGFFPQAPLSQTLDSFAHFHDRGNSGSNACQAAVCMGYRKIILLGVDCNYREVIPEAEVYADKGVKRLVVKEEVSSNPNYWFDDYQQIGDRYNIPNAHVFQKPGWENLAVKCNENGIDVVNCSEGSKLDCFRKSTLENEI